MTEAPLFADQTLLKAVHDAYSLKAKVGADTEYSNRVAKAFGYTADQLQSIPDEAHMGLSCGNPVATASIKEGEHILDLGSGGGMDILLAAAKVGPNGRAIGLDISADMISLARKNASKQSLKPPHVSFVHASLTEPLPIKSDSIDCILSNCVVNLLPMSGKASLFKEIYRVLKPGGRIVLDDIVAKKPLPGKVLEDLASHVGCIAGAIEGNVYMQLLADAGFNDVLFVVTKSDLNVYFKDTAVWAAQTWSCCGSEVKSNKSPSDVMTERGQVHGGSAITPNQGQEIVKETMTLKCSDFRAAPDRNKREQTTKEPQAEEPKAKTCWAPTRCVSGAGADVQQTKAPAKSYVKGEQEPSNGDATASATGPGAGADSLEHRMVVGNACGPARSSVSGSDFDVNEWVASYQIYAVKHAAPTTDANASAEDEPLQRWWDAYPKEQSKPRCISPDEITAIMRTSGCGTAPSDELAVIDVRRNDHGGGHVVGSFQRPAETFYDELDAFHEEFGGRKVVVFYCSSSSGRGPRCAAWYQDYLQKIVAGPDEQKARAKNALPEVLVLDAGIKGWLKKFQGIEDNLIEYD